MIVVVTLLSQREGRVPSRRCDDEKKKLIAGLLASTLLFVECGCRYEQKIKMLPVQVAYNEELYKGLDFSYRVVPEIFEIIVERNGVTEFVYLLQETREVSDYKEEEGKISWWYPKEEKEVVIEKKDDYLDVTMTSYKEGKYIPKDDTYWKDYLDAMEMDMMESLSMGQRC